MVIVVRCPGCRGASRVGPEAIGLLVVCPRCSDPFLAVEDRSPLAPASPPSPPPSRPATPPPTHPTRGEGRRTKDEGRRTRDASRRAPPQERGPTRSQQPRGWAEPVAPPADHPRNGQHATAPGEAGASADPHHTSGAEGLPLSVMIGLALLPFVIPLVWLIAPLVFGHQPALSVATPVALAISFSALCLAVVYTIDWSGTTRLKGVVMLVGLAHFAGLSLFFLKKDMVDRIQAWVAPAKEKADPEDNWREFHPDDQSYVVRMPGPDPVPTQDQPIPGWALACVTTAHKAEGGRGPIKYMVGSGDDLRKNLGNNKAWFEQLKTGIVDQSGGVPDDTEINLPLRGRGPIGRQWVIRLPNQQTVRIVRVHRVDGRVYYLAAEGNSIREGDPSVNVFFASFRPTPKK